LPLEKKLTITTLGEGLGYEELSPGRVWGSSLNWLYSQ